MLSSLDYLLVAVYFVVTVGLGLHYARRWKGSEDYFLAGRSLTWPIIGLSLFATNISTEHFVGLAAGGNREGLVQGGYEWIASYCLLMLAAVFAPQYLKHRVFTIPEFFEKRYGLETRLLLAQVAAQSSRFPPPRSALPGTRFGRATTPPRSLSFSFSRRVAPRETDGAFLAPF